MAVSPRASARRCSKARVYDDTGQPVTASFMDYAMPRRAGRPAVVSSCRTPPTLCPGNPLGVKGCGEGRRDRFRPPPSSTPSTRRHRQQQARNAGNTRPGCGTPIHGLREDEPCMKRPIIAPPASIDAAALFTKGFRVQISCRRSHPDPGNEAAARRAFRRDRSRGGSRRWSASRLFRRCADHQGGDEPISTSRRTPTVEKSIPAIAHLTSMVGDPAVR